jgi:hypothetical protein
MSADGGQVDPLIAEAVLFAPARALVGIADSHYELLESRAVEAQHPDELEEIAELEEAFKVASRSFEANQEGLLKEVGLEHRRKLDELAAPIAEEVRAEFEKEKKREEKPADHKRTAGDFSDALKMDWPEKSKLIDSLIASY